MLRLQNAVLELANMKGTVLTDPIPNGKRIEFDLFQEDTGQTVWCYSSHQFDKSILMKKGDKIELDGKYVNDQSTGKLVSFVFDSFIKIR
jgi:hypothetical protein